MKKFIFILSIIVVFNDLLVAQSDDKPVKIKPGVGFGFGFFYPGDVNDYISDYYSGTSVELGTTDIILNMFIRGDLKILFRNRFELDPLVEYAFAPKFVTGMVEDKIFVFSRVSPGVMANIHFPFRSGRHSFFIGCGGLAHFMFFEDFSGFTIGPSAQVGLSLNFRSINPQFFIGFNYAKARGEKESLHMDLDYTDFHLGIKINF
jgi:hypothetical protein